MHKLQIVCYIHLRTLRTTLKYDLEVLGLLGTLTNLKKLYLTYFVQEAILVYFLLSLLVLQVAVRRAEGFLFPIFGGAVSFWFSLSCLNAVLLHCDWAVYLKPKVGVKDVVGGGMALQCFLHYGV